MPRAVLYARVSKGVQDVGLQLDELRVVGTQRGWTVVAEVVDHLSGAKDDRPGLAQVLELARRGRADVVAIWRLDRLARSVTHLLAVAKSLQAWGVDLVSLRDPIDTTTPAGRFQFQVLAAVAELERELIRERSMAGQARARACGVHVGRPQSGPGRDEVLAAVKRYGGQRAAARALGVPPSLVRRRIRQGAL